MKRGNGFVSLGIFVGALALGSSFARGVRAAEVSVPCNDERIGSFLRSCDEVMRGHGDIKGQLDLLDQSIDYLSKQFYKGEAPDPTIIPGYWLDNAPPFMKPVCDLTSSALSANNVEQDTNHQGDGCGSPAKVSVYVPISDSTLSAPDVGTPVLTIDFNTAQKEGSFMRGAYVAALQCHWQQVRKELASRKQLHVSRDCEVYAEIFQQKKDAHDKLLARLRDPIAGMPGDLATQASHCKLDGLANAPDSAKKVQLSAPELCSAATGLEAIFAVVVKCEAIARAGNAFAPKFLDNPKAVADDIHRFLSDRCSQRCTGDDVRSKCEGTCKKQICVPVLGCADTGCDGGRCTTCVSAWATQCGDTCYRSVLPEWYRQAIAAWPADGSCK